MAPFFEISEKRCYFYIDEIRTIDMTFEEFKELANNPPRKKQGTIFVLSSTVIDDLPERCRQHYPEYEISPDWQTGYFHTLEEAERAMRKFVDENSDDLDDIFCFEIKERSMSELLYPSAIVSHRVYNAKGQLVEQTLCAGGCFTEKDYVYGIFRGRTEDQMRFKPGDIVEFLWRNKVMLGFVVCQPLSVEECWKMQQRFLEKKKFGISDDDDYSEYFGSDGGDDNYIVLTSPSYASHNHVHVTRVFAPHFAIPNYMRKKLEDSYQKWLGRQ